MATYLEQQAERLGVTNANRVSIPVDHVLQPNENEPSADKHKYLEITGVYAWAQAAERST